MAVLFGFPVRWLSLSHLKYFTRIKLEKYLFFRHPLTQQLRPVLFQYPSWSNLILIPEIILITHTPSIPWYCFRCRFCRYFTAMVDKGNVRKGKVARGKASPAKIAAVAEFVDHTAKSQPSSSHLVPESAEDPQNIHVFMPESAYHNTQHPLHQQSTSQRLVQPPYCQQYSGSHQLDPSSLQGQISRFKVDPSVQNAYPYAQQANLPIKDLNIPSPYVVIAGQELDLPFESVKLPPLLNSDSLPNEASSTAPSYESGKHPEQPNLEIHDDDAYHDWGNSEEQSVSHQGDSEETDLTYPADGDAVAPSVTTGDPLLHSFDEFLYGDGEESEESDAYSDMSGEERPWLHIHPRPKIIVETSLDTDVLCASCIKLCTSMLAPWDIEEGWSVVRPFGAGSHGLLPRLIAEHHLEHTLGNLKQSAAKGCALCTLISHQCERDEIWFPETDNNATYLIFLIATKDGKRMEDCSFSVTLEDPELGRDTVVGPTAPKSSHFQFFRQLGRDSDFEALTHQELFNEASQDLQHYVEGGSREFKEYYVGYFWPKLMIYANPRRDSAESIARVQRMLTECIEHHESCGREKSSLPKRVLDVSKSASRVFVHVSDGQEDDSRYMALSYAWGIGLPLKTVKANLESHRELGIPVTSLPRTIRDAVFVTRALHCRYLWVDALCIIQDDDPDWEEQCPRMTDIYREAILTISASSSESMESGFLERPTVNEVALKLGSYHHTEAPGYGDLFIRPLDQDKIERNGEAAIMEGFLNTRGWIFQERLASTAVVHYTDGEIVWECNHGPRSETMGLQSPFDWESSELKTMLTGPTNKPNRFLDAARGASVSNPTKTKGITWQKLFDTWMLWVIRYTPRDLTKRKDRLPAIGGLAKVLSSRFGLTYVAGLWQESLPAGLLWFRVLHSPEKKRTEINRDPHVPSWSWGSVSGSIGFRGWQSSSSARLSNARQPFLGDLLVHHVEMHGDPSRAFGKPFSGAIDVEGLLQRTVIDLEAIENTGDHGPAKPGFHGTVVQGLVDGVHMVAILDEEQEMVHEAEPHRQQKERNKLHCFCLRICTYWPLSMSSRFEARDEHRTLREVAFDLKAGVQRGSSDHERSIPPEPGNNLICLVLTDVDLERNIFRRIGYAETDIEDRERQSEGAFDTIMECDFLTTAEWKKIRII